MRLLCEAGGFPPPVITWYKNGYPIKDARRQFKERNLEIKEIVFEDRGTYTCTAENLLGRTELSVKVTVEVPTRFKAKPEKSVTAYKTWDAIIKCDIFGYPTPAITWTRSLKQLPLNRHVIDYNRLIIRNTTKDDDGAYVCQGTNKLGSVMAVTWVIVKDVVNPNMVFSPPNEINVQNVGDTVKLNCSAGGAPLPRVKWLRDGKRVYSTAVFHEHNLITSELVILGFQPGDVAIYKCIFYNEKNVTAEANISLALVNCGNPGTPSNGQKLGERYWTGQSVSFVCDSQYHLTGSATRMCLPSGNWSGIQPSCRRACPHLPRLKYGFSTGQQFWEGKRVLFHCKAGYRLSGPSEIFCNENGTWTGDQPTCSQGLEISSSILGSDEFLISHLSRFLEPVAGSHSRWSLCWRASSHGWSSSAFHSYCNGKPKTVTIIRKDQFVFGGYTDVSWGSGSSYNTDDKAFIFSLVNKEGLEPFKSMVKNPSYAIYSSSSRGPRFGSSDISISSDAKGNTNSYTSFGNQYFLPSGVKYRNSILAGTYNFSPDEVEVFQLI